MIENLDCVSFFLQYRKSCNGKKHKLSNYRLITTQCCTSESNLTTKLQTNDCLPYVWRHASQEKSALLKIKFLFLAQIICCGYSKEPSHFDGSCEHPKHMLKLIGKKLRILLR